MGNIKSFDISLERFNNTIKSIEKAGWNTSEPMFWGFYFIDSDQEKLSRFADLVAISKFNNVELRKIKNKWLLHLEKNTIYTAKTLYETCLLLKREADESAIEIFDGWDVEKEPMSKGLAE